MKLSYLGRLRLNNCGNICIFCKTAIVDSLQHNNDNVGSCKDVATT